MAVTITLMRIGSVTVTSLQAFASGLLNRKEDSYGSRNTYGRLAVQQASLYELEEEDSAMGKIADSKYITRIEYDSLLEHNIRNHVDNIHPW